MKLYVRKRFDHKHLTRLSAPLYYVNFIPTEMGGDSDFYFTVSRYVTGGTLTERQVRAWAEKEVQNYARRTRVDWMASVQIVRPSYATPAKLAAARARKKKSDRRWMSNVSYEKVGYWMARPLFGRTVSTSWIRS